MIVGSGQYVDAHGALRTTPSTEPAPNADPFAWLAWAQSTQGPGGLNAWGDEGPAILQRDIDLAGAQSAGLWPAYLVDFPYGGPLDPAMTRPVDEQGNVGPWQGQAHDPITGAVVFKWTGPVVVDPESGVASINWDAPASTWAQSPAQYGDPIYTAPGVPLFYSWAQSVVSGSLVLGQGQQALYGFPIHSPPMGDGSDPRWWAPASSVRVQTARGPGYVVCSRVVDTSSGNVLAQSYATQQNSFHASDWASMIAVISIAAAPALSGIVGPVQAGAIMGAVNGAAQGTWKAAALGAITGAALAYAAQQLFPVFQDATGTQAITPDGTTVTLNPDGGASVIYPDGSQGYVDPNGYLTLPDLPPAPQPIGPLEPPAPVDPIVFPPDAPPVVGPPTVPVQPVVPPYSGPTMPPAPIPIVDPTLVPDVPAPIDPLTGIPPASSIPALPNVPAPAAFAPTIGADGSITWGSITQAMKIAAAAVGLVRTISGAARTVGASGTRTVNPNGTVTTTYSTGGSSTAPLPVGQPTMATDGSLLINNGDGTYTRIAPDGTVSKGTYATSAPGIASVFANLPTSAIIVAAVAALALLR